MSEVESPPTRGTLMRWAAWFGIVNAALFALVGIRYLLIFGRPDDWLSALYVVFAYIGQFAALGYLPIALLGVVLTLVWPRTALVISVCVLAGAVGLSLMVLDTNVFGQYRFHLSALSVALFDTSTWALTATVFIAFLGLQALLAGRVWNFVTTRRSRHGGVVALALVLVWCGGQGIHIWADATAYTQVTSFTRFMPMYFPIKAKRRLASLGWIDPDEVEKQRMLRQVNAPDSGQLRYPLQPLSCDADPATTPNIIMLLVDALRPDRITPTTMPVTARFAGESLRFADHYSGGNSSRMGFFSLFYGLPSTYWQSFYDLQRQPVLLEELQQRDYEIKAFSAVGFGSPAQIDRTVFAGLAAAARTAADTDAPINNNVQVSDALADWLQQHQQSTRPLFGFAYYDPGSFAAVHESALSDALAEAERADAAYMAGMAHVDVELGKVLATLESIDNGRDTLIVITSDHGYEFDELGLGYIGHASNYAEYQLRSTLLMRWPGRAPRTYSHRSAHQDVPVTLLQEVFACTNPAADYSSGRNLFAAESWDWMIAGSYTSHAILQPQQLVVTYPGGLIELLGPDYRPDRELQLDAGLMQDAMLEMRRFYR
ncbi:MAG: DUF3413 domain-containing protein [Gammaproteobacteria bacterium]|nr:DUF3413 domain-containing protein [Gammaproteobacteria bacterium]